MRGFVVGLIVIFLCTVATVAGERCGKDYGGRKCSTTFCCSQYGWCDITADHCSPQKNCQSYCWTSDGGAANVTARYTYYNPEQINYDLNATHVACASIDGDKPLKWRSKFGWTAFCGPVGPKGQDACGKCLRLLHTRRNQGAAVYATVRVVDTCGYEAFVLDSAVFNHLDFDGEGNHNGYLQLSYDFIDCEDDDSDFFSIV